MKNLISLGIEVYAGAIHPMRMDALDPYQMSDLNGII